MPTHQTVATRHTRVACGTHNRAGPILQQPILAVFDRELSKSIKLRLVGFHVASIVVVKYTFVTLCKLYIWTVLCSARTFGYLWNWVPARTRVPGYLFQDTISGFNIYYLVPTNPNYQISKVDIIHSTNSMALLSG